MLLHEENNNSECKDHILSITSIQTVPKIIVKKKTVSLKTYYYQDVRHESVSLLSSF